MRRRPLSPDEIDRYLTAVQTLRVPEDTKSEFLMRLRAFMEADDGRPFYNLNLMRYSPQLRRVPGDPDFEGTPEESNAYYERTIAPMFLKAGVFPTFTAVVREKNLYGYGARLDNWHRIVIARYPSRRTLMDLLTNPEYQKIERYKTMALDELLLVPAAGKLVLPNPIWLVFGACVTMLATLAFVRSARRR